MKKLILCLGFCVATLSLQAGNDAKCKEASGCAKATACCQKGCSKASKDAAKVESPKGKEQAKK